MTGPQLDFRALPNVAGRALGSAVLWTNDEFFADVHSLISATAATHDPTLFHTRGKAYDGWETRRRRESGHDAVIIRLGTPALIRGVNIDTAFFKGNFPPFASVEGTTLLGYPSVAELLDADWVTLLDRTALEGDTANVFATSGADQLITHLRLSIYPDGGVARFRAYGEVQPDPRFLGGRVDVAATTNGGRIAGCSNMFYSSPANVLAPGRANVMSDGWETARRRDEANDWLVVELAAPARLHSAVIDTSRFVGNAPGTAQLSDAVSGRVLLARTPLSADTEHRFRLDSTAEVSQVRLDIFPDGGISRLRLLGEIVPAAREKVGQRWLSLLPSELAGQIDPSSFFD
ncbi:MAG: allantoicase [Frankiales bacterium]|nr:allantoicase [Frankiales bacterium]